METAESTKLGGFYWIMRNEPDGPPFWEVAQHVEFKFETWDYWNNRDSDVPKRQDYWMLVGKVGKVRQVKNGSNAWKVGGLVDHPNERNGVR